ncbi:hypothetical protein ACJJTC_007528 [Scirpophaga incertulas]
MLLKIFAKCLQFPQKVAQLDNPSTLNHTREPFTGIIIRNSNKHTLSDSGTLKHRSISNQLNYPNERIVRSIADLFLAIVAFTFILCGMSANHLHLPSSDPQTRGMISKMAEQEASSKQSCRASRQLRMAMVPFIPGPGGKEILTLGMIDIKP